MKKTMRLAWGALLGLGLVGCGPMEEQESPLAQDEQSLEAGCTTLGSNINTHACGHYNTAADHVARTASATRSTTTAPDISTTHKAYDIALPAGAEGSVKYTPTSTGSVVFYRNNNAAFTVVNASTSATVAPALNNTPSVCGLTYASVYDLTAGTTYILAAGPVAGNAITVVAEYLNDNRVRYYLDSDNDGYGGTTSVYTACVPPSGYITPRFDCNDANVSVNPGATEVCGNGVDDNCDGVSC